MATETLHYHLIKPVSADRVAVSDINDNSDTIDGYLFQANERAAQMADDYNASETYNTGDYVRRENYLYKCNTDNTTGTWDVTKWDRVKVMEEITQGGGGGSSTLAGLNDVNISSPTDGQALVYDNATQKWVNRAGGGGSSTFAGLNDVDVAGVANNDIARFNSYTQKWEKSSDLTDLELAVSQISASTLGITNGHTILDSNGTAMAQEDVLQFASGYVEDDSVNGKTVYIEMIRISQANYDTLKANGQLKPGAKYFIYDAQPVAVNASNLPYDNTKSVKDVLTLNPLTAKTNVTINRGGYVQIDKMVLVSAVVTLSATFNASAPIIDGVPGIGENNAPLVANEIATGFASKKARVYGGTIYTGESYTAGTYSIFGIYTVP